MSGSQCLGRTSSLTPSEPAADSNLYYHRALIKPANDSSHPDTLLSTAPITLRTKSAEQRICFLCDLQLGQAPRASQKRHICKPAHFRALKVSSGLATHRTGPVGPAHVPKASSHVFLGPEALQEPLPLILLQSWPRCPKALRQAHKHVHTSPRKRPTQDRAAGAVC